MDYSFISNAHPAYIEGLYQQYLQSPESVTEGWRNFFLGFDYALNNADATDSEKVNYTSPSQALSPKEFSVLTLIEGYRKRGHLLATTNPIRNRKFRFPCLDLQYFGLNESDLEQKFVAGSEIGLNNASLKEIISKLKQLYTSNIGFEFAHIENQDKYLWLKNKIEAVQGSDYDLSIEKKKRILEKLNGAAGFENFLAKKFVAQKRFGLEGGESTIPALDGIINRAAQLEVEEVVIGMAHRGRLNVLANIMQKTYEYIFDEFEGNLPSDMAFGDGDVKYHLGFSSQITTPTGEKVDLKLAPNPSHLEAVNPVVQGFSRAKADILYKCNYDCILPILIHGDAAVAGQGVVYEVAQMSQLEGYYTGGTIHFVINNQVGFTTDFDDARSSTYCTAAANLVQAPIFHVNGDDPEAVLFVAELAAEYRQEFNTDVFIDLVCYRKHGHNEGDDPQFTQPQLYKLIKKHKNPRSIYTQKLIDSGAVEASLAKQMEKEFNSLLQDRFNYAKEQELSYTYQKPELAWNKLNKYTTSEDYDQSPETGIGADQVTTILHKMQELPENFTPLPKFKRILKRAQTLIDKGLIDWSMAEHLAYGSLLLDGADIRMSGQDVKRGTFSHRNAVLYDVETNKQYNRLNALGENQGQFRIYNSLLSEFAVLGFEFGYSLATPDNLVIWEAQFGDFANGAQTMFDQFISSSESKWHRMSGLTMLLPHGYEGQGPEHSSARLERYLQACAEHNITVANVTTPANFFHLIRRQLARPFRKPLVVMSPKKLLRPKDLSRENTELMYRECVSNFDQVASGRFEEAIDDPKMQSAEDKAKVKRILFCTGKVYYELLERKIQDNRDDIAIIRIEQLYPYPKKLVQQFVSEYPEDVEYVWVQEEPSNMGAWGHILTFYRKAQLFLIARKASASPATGYKAIHEHEQQGIIDRAFGSMAEIRASKSSYIPNEGFSLRNQEENKPEQVVDNLTKLNGLGPSMSQKLNELGIFSFKQLSTLDTEEIQKINNLVNGFESKYLKNSWKEQAEKLS